MRRREKNDEEARAVAAAAAAAAAKAEAKGVEITRIQKDSCCACMTRRTCLVREALQMCSVAPIDFLDSRL